MSIYAAYRRQRNSAAYLFAEHGHSERSEESQHVEIVIHWPINTCERVNHTTGLRPMEMHPYSPAGTSPKGKRVTGFSVALRLPTNPVPLPPRRGKFALRSASELISTSMHSTAKSSPSGGKVVPKVPKGVHFQRPQGVLLVFHGRSPVVRFSIPRSGIIKLIARRAIPSPLNPLNPLNLLNPFSLHNPSTQPTAKPCPFRAHGNIVKHR